MKSTRVFASIAVIVGLMVGCSDDNGTEPTGLTVADLEGSWTILKWEYQSVADPTLAENLVTFGFSGTITVAAGGGYTGQITIPNIAAAICGALGGTSTVVSGIEFCTLPLSGSVSIADGVLSLGFANDLILGAPGCEVPEPHECDLFLDSTDPATFPSQTLDPSGTNLTLSGTGYEWNFLSDAVDGNVDSNLVIQLVRT